MKSQQMMPTDNKSTGLQKGGSLEETSAGNDWTKGGSLKVEPFALTEQLALVSIAKEAERDGVKFGVLKDGTAFMGTRGLARFCGVSRVTIQEHMERWEAGARDGAFAKLLRSKGYSHPRLHLGTSPTTGELVHPEQVCQAFVEYYAFHVKPPKDEALEAASKMMQAGMRAFVYAVVGYAPAGRPEFRKYLERMFLNPVPSGFFSVFKELADHIADLIRQGLPVDEHTQPDASVGKAWSLHWEENDLDAKFGMRIHHEHNYPPDHPQAASNPQEVWIYPDEALHVFRKWRRDIYMPEKFPHYIERKVKQKSITDDVAVKLLSLEESKPLPRLEARKRNKK